MKRFVWFLCSMLILFSTFNVQAEILTRNADNEGIREKEWKASNAPAVIFGELVDPTNEQADQYNCSAGEGWNADKALRFDISVLRRNAGERYDVNKIYVDGVALGEVALANLKADWLLRGYGSVLMPLNDLTWDEQYPYTCVGKLVRTSLWFQLGIDDSDLEDIVLWYDGPIGSAGGGGGGGAGGGDIPPQTIKQSLDDHDENFGSATPTPYTETTRTITEEDLKFKVTTPYEIDHHRKKFVPNQDSLKFKIKVKNTGSHTPPSKKITILIFCFFYFPLPLFQRGIEGDFSLKKSKERKN